MLAVAARVHQHSFLFVLTRVQHVVAEIFKFLLKHFSILSPFRTELDSDESWTVFLVFRDWRLSLGSRVEVVAHFCSNNHINEGHIGQFNSESIEME